MKKERDGAEKFFFVSRLNKREEKSFETSVDAVLSFHRLEKKTAN